MLQICDIPNSGRHVHALNILSGVLSYRFKICQRYGTMGLLYGIYSTRYLYVSAHPGCYKDKYVETSHTYYQQALDSLGSPDLPAAFCGIFLSLIHSSCIAALVCCTGMLVSVGTVFSL